jgi:hypothetical protein
MLLLVLLFVSNLAMAQEGNTLNFLETLATRDRDAAP